MNGQKFPNNINTSNTFPNALYAPFGTNDNNSSRRSYPSNTYPMNGGYNGQPMGQYNPISTNTQAMMHKTPSMSNFSKAFDKTSPIIDKINYTNQNTLLHNNVGESVLDETVVEYRVNIDSLDRDLQVYLNPFQFNVKFNAPARGIYEEEVFIDPSNKSLGTKIQSTVIPGPPRPYINEEFKNVKYIKLENIVLPQYSNIVELDDGAYILDPNSNLLKDRYITMQVKELEYDRVFNTSDSVTRYNSNTGKYFSPQKPFAIIIPDKIYSTNFYAGTPYYGTRIYKSSDLGNIGQFSINFADSFGIPLKFNNLYTFQELVQAEIDGNPIPTTDIRHPYNKLLQVHVSFIIGVVESQINKNTKFEY
jgi:hypothetical protein